MAFLDDAWELSLGANPTWTRLEPAGIAPSARYRHGAVYDSVGEQMIVFGGSGSPPELDDVWTLSLAGTPEWQQLTASGITPQPRYAFANAYRPTTGDMVVFGGDGGAMTLEDTWVFSPGSSTWAPIVPAGTPPSPQASWPSGVYDRQSDRMLILSLVWRGGDVFTNDVSAISFDGSPAWHSLSPSGTVPPTRSDASTIHDSTNEQLIIFGGTPTCTGCGSGYFDDTWALPLIGTAQWTEIVTSGASPARRRWHSAIFDELNERMIVFGGLVDGEGQQNDVWSLSRCGSRVRDAGPGRSDGSVDASAQDASDAGPDALTDAVADAGSAG